MDFFYTTILSENYTAQKILEKKRKSMPNYNYIGNYMVHCFKHNKKKILNVCRCDMKGLDIFYNKYSFRSNFFPANRKVYNLIDDDFFTFRDENGNIVMACAVWNQQNYKEYILEDYHGILRFLRYFPTKLLGYPSFPVPKSSINYGTIAFFCCSEEYTNRICDFLNTVSSMTSYSFLVYGIFENHPFCSQIKKLKSIKYSSKLYSVDWKERFKLDDKPIQLEVGLL